MKQEFKELRKLLELQWTQGTLARNAAGKSVDVLDPSAVSFCIEGGITRVVSARTNYGPLSFQSSDVMYNMRKVMRPLLPNDGHIPTWNDARERKLDEVLGLVDRCIELVD